MTILGYTISERRYSYCLYRNSGAAMDSEEKIAMTGSSEQSQEMASRLRERTLGEPQSNPSAERPGKKILVVEDTLETAEMLCIYLEFCGYEVLSTGWGRDALEICQESHPDLIILDIQLLDTDGYEVYRELSGTQETSHIPVIFLTKLIDDDLKAICQKTRKLDYISKPFDLEELGRRVRDALGSGEEKPCSGNTGV